MKPVILRELKQGSEQWLRVKLGVPTASGFKEILTPKFALRTGETPRTYLYKKLAEKMTGAPLPAFNNRAIEHGHTFEEEARDMFSLTTGLDVEQVGFIVGADGRCGCSPDGLIGDDSGLEVKCPNAETHLKYLDANEVPDEYVTQVHGSIWVSQRKSWRFMSYYPELPPLILTVERDEEVMGKFDTALAKFYADFDAAMDRLQPERKAA